MKKFLRIFFTSFIIFTMVLGTGLYFIVAKEKKEDVNKIEAVVSTDEKEKGERINVLLLGVDNLDSANKGSRTDTMMVLSMDTKTKDASILSIPRDTRVKLRGRTGYDKINAAHAYGGVDLSVKAVKDLLGIPIHHYVKVDYKALEKTVDDLGGVEVDVPMNMNYDDPYATPPLHIHLKKGRQTLDGEEAMEFLRFRKGYANQDLGRIQAQQQFLDSLISKVLSPSSIFKIGDYIETFHMYVETDMSTMEMMDLGLKASKINPDEIRNETVPGEPKMINNVSYFIADTQALEELTSELYYNESDDENISNKDVKLAVLNGCGRAGIATDVSDELIKDGFKPDLVGNADDFNNEKTIIYYDDDKEAAENVKNVLGVGEIRQDSSVVKKEKMDIIVLIGNDI